MAFSIHQQRALAVIPKVTGNVSAFFSGLIIYTIVRNQNRRSRTYHRLLFGISCCDVSASLWLALSTWPVPKSSGLLWAIGNDTSCNVQGFFTQFGIASSFYNASLSVYYVLVIRYGWKEHQLRKVEPLLHTFPLLWATVTAIAGLIKGVFGNASLWCWVAAENKVFRWAAFYGPLWLMIGIVTVNTTLIYVHVRKIERAATLHRLFRDAPSTSPVPASTSAAASSQELSPQPSTPKSISSNFSSRLSFEAVRSSLNPTDNSAVTEARREDINVRRSRLRTRSRYTREVAIQSFLYAGAFYLNWFALTITRLLQQVNGKVYFPLLLLAALTVPLQGLPNFLVYLLPRLKKLRTSQGRERITQKIASRMSRLTSPSVVLYCAPAYTTPQSELLPEIEAIDALVEESDNQDGCEDLPTLIKDLEMDINELEAKSSSSPNRIEQTA
ncbi:hypothetical protein FisN_8Lh297 [Fistulifera solaris]|uniref:Glucose receptor Git3-like N-terminal domain-containing protein n=1 Tax=Fistulifera solaris TaxID=1519565 RepID=A0A1Z5JN19_FISSO|nr:hypothetical protein FisN_8Lh297 [Fistulifera solaris]|eukprot:GAX15407.1 hypothetical protein FisN_8Lh297 [Fistulifera solaris]